MSGSRASIRYAKALISLAKERGREAAMLSEMKDIAATLENSKELRLFLGNPIINTSKKGDALKGIFAKMEEAQELFHLLAKNNRTDLLASISENYIALSNAEAGIQAATVTTAVALTPELEKEVLAKVKSLTDCNEVKLHQEVDPDIIGGFILRVGDLQYNASIANKLSNLKRTLVDA
ncbi:ATP synthase F1 subunit delta [Croceiramulus getboli]|nr:ATP synthase F1 subunit delta [Flavobacteriaceae bacterium YJPT1-3]